MRSPHLALLLAPAILLHAPSALADRGPTLATDCFYVGTRIDPGAALTAAWDLDIYLVRNRAVSVGPGVSLSVLGGEVPDGRTQDLLLAVDVFRLKVGVNEPGARWRPFFLLGGGFSYARLPEQWATGVTVAPSTDRAGARTTGDRLYPALDEFAPMGTLGAGGDFFFGSVATTALFQVHFHLSGTERLPDAWAELSLGFRFGL